MLKMVALHPTTYLRLRQLRDSSCGTFDEVVSDLLVMYGIPDLKYEEISIRAWDEK